MLTYRVMRWLRNFQNCLLVVLGLFLFLFILQRIVFSFSNRIEGVFSEVLRSDLLFFIAVMAFSILILLMWRSIKNNFLDQKNEFDKLTASKNVLTENMERFTRERFTDVLTGTPNEFNLYSFFKAFWEDHPTRSLSLIYTDVDSFKKINSKLGADKADIILRALALRLRSGIRRDEEVFRVRDSNFLRNFVGGDEFVLLIHGDEKTCLLFMKRVFSEMLPELSAELRERFDLGARFSLSISAGSCTYSPSEKRRLRDENNEDLRRVLSKILFDANQFLQSAKNNDFGVCYVWSGLARALDDRPEEYERFISFFPHKHNS